MCKRVTDRGSTDQLGDEFSRLVVHALESTSYKSTGTRHIQAENDLFFVVNVLQTFQDIGQEGAQFCQDNLCIRLGDGAGAL